MSFQLMPLRHLSAPNAPADSWPAGGGECGRLIRERDWSNSGLGPVASWPAALRITVSNMLGSPVPQVLMWGSSHVMLYNDGYIDIAGCRHPQALGGLVEQTWPEVWDWNRDILARGFAGEVVGYRDQPVTLHRNGRDEHLYFDLFYTPVRDEAGRVEGVLCTVIDNSARVKAEQEAGRREAEMRLLTNALPVMIAYFDRDLVCRFANTALADFLGMKPDDVLGRHWRELAGPDGAERAPLVGRALAGAPMQTETTLIHRDGSARRVEIRYIPRIGSDGSVAGFQSLTFDVEERVRREEALAVSNSRFRSAMDAVHGVLWTTDGDGRMVDEQPGWAALTGQRAEDYAGYGWTTAVHPADVEPTLAAWRRAIETGAPYAFEHRVRRFDNQWRVFLIRAVRSLSPEGRVIGWVGVHTDITERRAAEEALREQAAALTRQIAHRRHAEEQLRQLNETLEARIVAEIAERRQAEMALVQAQKMETIGQLTGGIAHDFNNLLQIVSGNLQLLERDVAGDEKAYRRVANAMAGVERGAKLASQLLAFGRRQALEPRTVNIARLIHGMDAILRRAVGEAVAIEWEIADALWNTFVDPARVENALLNLVINARDAMEGQGRLTIALANATLPAGDEHVAGDYVRLSVADTGSGMPPEIADRVFEPFFSTKREGKGTGLGLSMVYGFVRQSGGHVVLKTAPARGTTVELYFPRAAGAEEDERIVGEAEAVGGTETVLVVEDDEAVRATVVEMFRDLGYTVLTAASADAALAILADDRSIDLVFTDVVMPGRIDSAAMARAAQAGRPDLAVLFTSGYAEDGAGNGIVHGGRLDPGLELLPKPYSREALARRVRQVLARRGRAADEPLLSIPPHQSPGVHR
ncbi:two-component system sensor histidine kinase/response regulator [Sphingomonas metalli]|uniref:histidine kinase n=1 Tax=Sphingomonas metalli TaxID=1779358 RepID=A0A916SV16_9SPHN|nr:PAS domain-containing sensor histidine kinase [Sphingomonas metalli]GGB18409.1 two-component system sensor histidine kinase/response regulator [Sphingomonas metalli]